MAIANLTVQQPTIPKPDFSWLDGIAESLGGVIDQAGDTRLARQALGSMSAAPQQQPTGGFLSRLAPQQQPQAQAPQTAAVTPVYRGDLQGDTYRPFIDTVRAGGLTNPYGLAAVASTGKAESGWSAKNANRTWSDPSESGQAGTAGGILSWRGPRYQALAATGDLSPEGQAKFFLQENPQLIQALNNASSVEEAQQLMNKAWAFAGYNRPGGEAGRRLAMAKSYYASEFGNTPPANGGAAAIEAIAPLEQGDTSGTETAYVDPYVKVEPRQEASAVTQAGAAPYTMASSTAPTQQSRPPMQVADASGSTGIIAQGVTPIQRGSVDPDLIARMIGNPRLRDFGIALWKQNSGQAGGEPWQFATLPDGTLVRQNQQTGSIESVGNFAKHNGGFQVLSAEERQALNIPQTDYRVYQRGPDGKIDAVGGAGQTINVGNEVEARRQAAAQAGLTPDDPAYQGFILTGKLPRENEQSLTATDKKAILEADEMVQSTQNVLPLIDRALQLNDKAYSGPTAGLRGLVTGALGMEGGEATQELDNVVINGALTQLKAIFGGAPTEGERAILLDMSGASNQPAPVRRTIFERAKQAAERRLKFYQQRATDMRGGTYYKPGTSTPSAPTAPTPPSPPQDPSMPRVTSQSEYDRLPSGARYTDPNGNIRTKR
ncbi:hypothetical protein ACWGMK_06230 [Agrobacterium deltaense]